MGHHSCLMVEKTAQRANWLSGPCWGESGANPALTQAPGTGPASVFEKLCQYAPCVKSVSSAT